MSDWKIIVPEGITNLVSNPSFETNLTNWTLVDADVSVTRTRTADGARFGAFSLRMVNTDAGDDDYSRLAITVLPNTTYTLSAWVNVTVYTGPAAVNRGLFFFDGIGQFVVEITAATDGWERLELTFTTAGGAGAGQDRPPGAAPR